MRLGVSPAAGSPSMGVFTQWFEALFPHAEALGCVVCFAPLPFLLVYLCANVGLWGLLAVALPAPFHNPPPRWVRQPPLCRKSSPPRLPVSAPPTGLDECFFFISLVLRLLIENARGGWGGSRRDSQPHRRGHWRDPQGPRAYTSPPTRESAPEGPNLIVSSGGSD